MTWLTEKSWNPDHYYTQEIPLYNSLWLVNGGQSASNTSIKHALLYPRLCRFIKQELLVARVRILFSALVCEMPRVITLTQSLAFWLMVWLCVHSPSLGSISTEHSPKLQIRSHSYLRAVSEVSINRSMESLDPKALLASPQYRSRNESYMRAMSTISQVCELEPLTNIDKIEHTYH